MDGALFKSKSGRKLHGFLFNDVLILAEPLKSLSQKGYLYSLYREVIYIYKFKSFNMGDVLIIYFSSIADAYR